NIGFYHLVDIQGGLNPGVDITVFQCVLEGQCIHDGGHHAHVVGRGTIHSLCAGCHATKDIAAPDDNGQFNARLNNFGDLFCHADDGGTIDAIRVVSHECFT